LDFLYRLTFFGEGQKLKYRSCNTKSKDPKGERINVMTSTLKAKKEERAQLAATMATELAKAQTTETRSAITKMQDDIETLSGDITRIERSDKITAELAAGAPVNGGEAREDKDAAVAYRKQYAEYLTRGFGNKAKGFRAARQETLDKLNSVANELRELDRRGDVEKRDQLAGSQSISYTQGTEGGFFVPAGFVYDIEKATKFYAPLLDGSVIRVMETATGQVLPYPTSNDTNQAWTLLGEATQVVDGGTTPNYPNQSAAPSANPGNVLAGHVNFNAYKGTTGIIRVSLELLQDSAFSIESFLTEAFAVRLGRGYEYYLTNGSGSNAPLGILPAIAASGATPVVAVGSSSNDGSANTGANSIGYIDLVNLIHSVDPSYRRDAKFMLADSTLRFLRTLLDKFGRPLWVPGVKDNEPDTICGHPYVINQAFPAIAASATTVAFGAWSKFIARKVKDLQVARLEERFADFGEVGYVGFSRIDSNLVDAGTHPLNVLQQHS
jgi:HK97 family phage major capsid protein